MTSVLSLQPNMYGHPLTLAHSQVGSPTSNSNIQQSISPGSNINNMSGSNNPILSGHNHQTGVPLNNYAHHLHHPQSQTIEIERTFFLRMKCVLAKRNAGLTTSGYKVSNIS